ncbi:MAG: hypothetical protein DRJ41_02885 [Thermoprotei archaeon]|nr:MAG: hypothetical protein DRJ41_02885 [Thermoprotei archaeon]
MRTNIALLILLILPLALTALPETELKHRIYEVYRLLVEAEKEGADTSSAASMLDRALQLVLKAESRGDRASLLEAENIISEVESMIPRLIEEGRVRVIIRTTTLIAFPLTLLVAGVITYIYGPKLLWRLWLRYRREWKVRKR